MQHRATYELSFYLCQGIIQNCKISKYLEETINMQLHTTLQA